jgi:mediator of RNA polymerase II transcription subunit 12
MRGAAGVERSSFLCVSPGWPFTRQSYANRHRTRLSAHLYSEHLLDREHFLDWLLLSLETCPIFRAPTWLLLTQVYWTDLLSSRRFGRRLVAAMCCHLREVCLISSWLLTASFVLMMG